MEYLKNETITEEEQELVKENGEFEEYLQVIYDSRADFYKKAKIIRYNNAIYLQSYSTIVAKIENGKIIINGWYSQTTARHINEFLLQNGFNKLTKKQMEGE